MTKPRKTRLLVVDDEPGMRRTLERIMKAKGFDVATAADGATAIAVAQAFTPDVLLLDVRMPGIDGVETWRQLKPICPNSVVIFMTAYASSERTDDARNEGALEVLSKPIDIDVVCQLVRQRQRPILIVDDDAGFRESLQRALSSLSFRVHTAADGDEAIRYFAGHPESVVLLDMKLKKGSGLEVLKRVRAEAEDVQVILMTGFDELAEDMRTGLDIGAVSSFVKPFNVNELVSEIRRSTESADAI